MIFDHNINFPPNVLHFFSFIKFPNSAPILARPFLADYHPKEGAFNGTKCDLEADLVRESEDDLETLFLIIGACFMVATLLYAIEWFAISRKFRTQKSRSELETVWHGPRL